MAQRISVSVNDYLNASQKDKDKKQTTTNTAKTGNTVGSRQTLSQSLEKIKEEYVKSASGGSAEGVRNVNYKVVENDPLERVANIVLQDSHDEKLTQAEEVINDLNQGIIDRTEDAENTYLKKSEEIASNYASDKKSAKDSAMKNGIQRSSIIEGVVDELKNSAQKEEKEAVKSYDEKLEKIAVDKEENKIAIDTMLQEINEQHDKDVESVVNQLKTAKYYADKNNQFYDEESYNDYKRKVVGAIYSYFTTFDKDSAITALQNDEELKRYLGEDYNDFLKRLKERKN